MNKLVIPNGYYADALPSGEYCAQINDKYVVTHLGNIALPSYMGNLVNPLFVRCSNIGGFKIAAQPSFGPPPGSLEYIASKGEWNIYSQVACGTSPVIYDHNGNLHISDCSIGVNGWRYCDYYSGALITGDNTYFSKDMHLWEYTDLGDGLFIGQSDYPVNSIQVYDVTRKLNLMFEPTAYRFVRAQRSGNSVAISMARNGGGNSLIVWSTLDELRALQPIAGSAPPSAQPPIELPPQQPTQPPNNKPPVLKEIHLYSDFKISEVLPLNGDYDEVPHPDGQGLVALKNRSTNKYKSLMEGGYFDPDKDSAGYCERFYPYGGGYLAYREGVKKMFTIVRIPKIPYMS